MRYAFPSKDTIAIGKSIARHRLSRRFGMGADVRSRWTAAIAFARLARVHTSARNWR